MSWLKLGNDEKRKYKIGDIVEDKWGRIGKIIALRGCSSCGQLYEIENLEGYVVEGNIKRLVETMDSIDKLITELHTQLIEKEQEINKLKEEKRKVRNYINKHCVNEKVSKEVGYKCYTMADTN